MYSFKLQLNETIFDIYMISNSVFGVQSVGKNNATDEFEQDSQMFTNELGAQGNDDSRGKRFEEVIIEGAHRIPNHS